MSTTFDTQSPPLAAPEWAAPGVRRPATASSAQVDLGAAAGLLEQLDTVLDGLQEFDPTVLFRRRAGGVPAPGRAAVPAASGGDERRGRRDHGARDPDGEALRLDRGVLRQLVNVSASEGAAWARDAEELVASRSMGTGQTLPPRLPAVAGAVAEGAISTTQARMIAYTLRRVPAAVGSAERAAGEERLVRGARQFDPAGLDRLCRRFLDCVDPDGSLGRNDKDRADRREFSIGRQDKWGRYPVKGSLDPKTGARVLAALDPLAAPQPTTDLADERTRGQRYHDALDELARRALAHGDLPVRHGLTARLLVTMTLDQLEARTGLVSTAHDGWITVRDLLRDAAETGAIPIVLDADGVILHFGEEQRLATPELRYALHVLDRGCTFEGCDVPAVWCQAAHTGDGFHTTRRTSIDELALLCGHHHRIVDSNDWWIERVNERVWITPPTWTDPDRRPRTNEYFKPLDDALD